MSLDTPLAWCSQTILVWKVNWGIQVTWVPRSRSQDSSWGWFPQVVPGWYPASLFYSITRQWCDLGSDFPSPSLGFYISKMEP